MKKYLYIFGYNSPAQLISNKLNNCGDEDSMALIIKANSVELAEEWGRTIAIKFNKQLFNDINFDWIKMNFANWAELVSESAYNEDDLTGLQIVSYGEMPEIGLMLSCLDKKTILVGKPTLWQ